MINTLSYDGFAKPIKDKNGQIIAKIPISAHLFLKNSGPLINITITHPKMVADKLQQAGKTVPRVTINALIDTGASFCAITQNVANQLMLLQTGFQNVTSVLNQQACPVFFAYFQFHWGIGKEIPVVACPLRRN